MASNPAPDATLYRQALFACLDQLAAALVTIETQRRQIQEMREERERYARDTFGRTPANAE